MAFGFNRGIQYKQSDTPGSAVEGEGWLNTTNGAYKKYQSGQWDVEHPYGYVAGGISSSVVSEIERLQFPFDSGTAMVIGNLSRSKYNLAGFNSATHGYILSGIQSGSYSTVERIEFPFNSGDASQVGFLSEELSYTCGFNSRDYGYNAGGDGPGLSKRSSIDRIEFPFDSGVASVTGSMSLSRSICAGCNSSNHGYIMGGQIYVGSPIPTSTLISTIDRIEFPFDSGIASDSKWLNNEVQYSAGCNSSTYGYNMAGLVTGPTARISSIDRIAFPFAAGTASSIGTLSIGNNGPAGVNSSTHGFSCGGADASNVYSNIDRFAFPFDSGVAVNVNSISAEKYNTVGVDATDFVSMFLA